MEIEKDVRSWEWGQSCGEENRGKEGDQFGYVKILAKEKSDLYGCLVWTDQRSEC